MTKEEALALAKVYNLEEEVKNYIEEGETPIDALWEWDIIEAPEEPIKETFNYATKKI